MPDKYKSRRKNMDFGGYDDTRPTSSTNQRQAGAAGMSKTDAFGADDHRPASTIEGNRGHIKAPKGRRNQSSSGSPDVY